MNSPYMATQAVGSPDEQDGDRAYLFAEADADEGPFAWPEELRDESKRSEVADEVSRTIFEAIETRGNLAARHKRNEDFYRNRKVTIRQSAWPGAPTIHIPITQPRIEQRKAMLVDNVTKHNPIARFEDLSEDWSRDEKMERIVHFIMRISGWSEKFRILCDSLFVKNHGFVRVDWGYLESMEHEQFIGPYTGPLFDIIDPDWMAIYPANGLPLGQCQLVGHYFEDTRQNIRARVEAGEWDSDADVEKLGAVGARAESDSQAQGKPSPTREGDLIGLYDVHWKAAWTKGKRPYFLNLIVHAETRTILWGDRPLIDSPNYAHFQIKQEVGKTWTDSSVAQDLQHLQVAINLAMMTFLWGVEKSSNPSGLVEGQDMGSQQLKPGEFKSVRSIGKALALTGTFNSGVVSLIQMLMMMADSAGKVSNTMTSSQAGSDRSTATEENIKLQGFQIATNDDVSAIAPAFRAMVLIVLAMMWNPRCYNQFRETYPHIELPLREELIKPMFCSLTGEAVADSPNIRMQQAQLLVQLARDMPQLNLPVIALVRSIVTDMRIEGKEQVLRGLEDLEKGIPAQQQAEAAQKALAFLLASMAHSLKEQGASDEMIRLITERVIQDAQNNQQSMVSEPGMGGGSIMPPLDAGQSGGQAQGNLPVTGAG